MIATSLNPPSEEDDIDGSDEENDEDMDADDSDDEDNDEDSVVEDDDTLNAELNSKGYIERGIVLSAERCEGAREYFKENADSREGRHVIDNGFRKGFYFVRIVRIWGLVIRRMVRAYLKRTLTNV